MLRDLTDKINLLVHFHVYKCTCRPSPPMSKPCVFHAFLIFLTCLPMHSFIRLNDRAEGVQDQSSHLGGVSLRALVVIQGVVGQNKPALLQLQGGALSIRLHLLLEPT